MSRVDSMERPGSNVGRGMMVLKALSFWSFFDVQFRGEGNYLLGYVGNRAGPGLACKCSCPSFLSKHAVQRDFSELVRC